MSIPAASVSKALGGPDSAHAGAADSAAQTADASGFSLLLALAGLAPQGDPSQEGEPVESLFGGLLAANPEALPSAATGTFLPPGGNALPFTPMARAGGYAAAIAVSSAALAASLQRGEGVAPGTGEGSTPLPDALLESAGDVETQPDTPRTAGGDTFRATLDARGLASSGANATGTNPANGQQAQAAFENSLGRQLITMARNGLNEATLELQPEHLGKLDVRLKVEGDSAQLQLVASSTTVRDALDQALPRLRELLGDAGLDLGNVDIGHRDRGNEQAGESKVTHGTADGGERSADEWPDGSPRYTVRAPEGLIDFFA